MTHRKMKFGACYFHRMDVFLDNQISAHIYLMLIKQENIFFLLLKRKFKFCDKLPKLFLNYKKKKLLCFGCENSEQ